MTQRITKLVMASSPPFIVGCPYNLNPKGRVIAYIETISKNGEMAPVDWYAISDEHGHLIAEANGKYVEAVIISRGDA